MSDAMATRHPTTTTRESIQKCNEAVSRRFRVTLATYKTIKATAQLAGVVAGLYMVQQGADPMTVYTIIGTILVGPEVFEYTIANGDGQSRDDDREN